MELFCPVVFVNQRILIIDPDNQVVNVLESPFDKLTIRDIYKSDRFFVMLNQVAVNRALRTITIAMNEMPVFIV